MSEDKKPEQDVVKPGDWVVAGIGFVLVLVLWFLVPWVAFGLSASNFFAKRPKRGKFYLIVGAVQLFCSFGPIIFIIILALPQSV